MENHDKQSSNMVRCDACDAAVPAYDVVSYGSMEQGYRELCTHCFNAEVAGVIGLDGFENVRLHPVVMTDCAGERHEFHFQMRLLGSIVTLDAFELIESTPGGYRFQIVGEPDDEPLLLLSRAIERMRRSLSIKYLVRDQHGMHIASMSVRGRIDWDTGEDGRLPLVVIDGEEVSWEEFGRILMSFEGWQFRLDMRDRSDEL